MTDITSLHDAFAQLSGNYPEAERLLRGKRVALFGKFGGMNRREARRVVRACGGIWLDRLQPDAEVIIVGADELPLEPIDGQLDDELKAAASRGRLQVITENQLLQQIGLEDPQVNVRRLYTPAMLAQLLQIPVSTVRRWHRRGLIVPARQVNRLPYFDFQEVAVARQLAQLVAAGASPSLIEKKLLQLSDLLPDVQRPLAQLAILVEGKQILLRRGAGLIEPGGQRRIDFDALESAVSAPQESPGEMAISFPRPADIEDELKSLATPEDYFQLACDYEDAEMLTQAIEIYRAMLLAFGPKAEICFRLAELLYLSGETQAARERYYTAIELDETFVEARASLGCVLVELGQLELAESAFRGALDHHPDYPDVHFHLARMYDELARSQLAEEHWRKFLALAPKSPWADEARDRLGIVRNGN